MFVIHNKAFPGRVVFDHLPKTAGQAINDWLTRELGTGCVTPNLIGGHHDLIRRYGGLYSVISAHVEFAIGERLDPRYQYITLLREPVDRIVSWLYFVVNNHDEGQLPELRHAAKRFLDSEGLDFSATLCAHISNAYVEHFCHINGTGSGRDDDKIADALSVICKYDVAGVYEDMSGFVRDVAALLGLAPPKEIARVNVTSNRPKVHQISSALRERIMALNQLDIRLYAETLRWKEGLVRKELTESLPRIQPPWTKYEFARERVLSTPAVTILNVTLREGGIIAYGQLMTFDVDFFLSREIHDLEMGIHLLDSDRQWAFGINSTSLGQAHQFLPRGSYRVSHHLAANLPTGKYTAGFAFAERVRDGLDELAWGDVMCEFEVNQRANRISVGYAHLPADISVSATNLAMGMVALQAARGHRFWGSDSRLDTHVGTRVGHDIASTGREGHLVFGPYIPLAAGEYRLVIRGTVGEMGIAGARVDVAADKGQRIFAECGLGEPDEQGRFVVLPVSLDVLCIDIEVRVWVSSDTDLRISMIEIESWQPSDKLESSTNTSEESEEIA